MTKKKCICGRYFLPNNKRNIRCPKCTCNPARVNRFKKRQSIWAKAWRLKNEITIAFNRSKYKSENREYHREYRNQSYIKENL